MSQNAYQPFEPARRPGSKPSAKPKYRVLVHRKFKNHWDEVVSRVGLQQAQQFWDHVSTTPGSTSALAATSILRGKAGNPMDTGWSKTYHYEISSSGRIDYQFHNAFKVGRDGDPHHVVAIMTVSFSSH